MVTEVCPPSVFSSMADIEAFRRYRITIRTTTQWRGLVLILLSRLLKGNQEKYSDVIKLTIEACVVSTPRH